MGCRCAAVARLRLRLPDHVRAAQGADAWPPVTLALEACGVPGRLEITPSQLELPQPLHLGQVLKSPAHMQGLVMLQVAECWCTRHAIRSCAGRPASHPDGAIAMSMR